ncbi:hypothetical protein WJX72_005155 [[Myrmecia] bisecta]|uniref:NADP-dependent oxidoreductase domain-containing protein n=1 Tax=[Myrmecia] bisecta TaxID=41462 RepID=A0AAW1QQD3_9CHLO
MATYKLARGASIPALAYGTGTYWYKRDKNAKLNRGLVDSIKLALTIGYRHIDTAEAYGTEEEVGVALKEFLEESDLQRNDIFVTTKVFETLPDVEKAINTSLRKLQLSYVDLYLIHAPFFKEGTELPKVWRQLEGLVQDGRAKAIGVSNFRVSDLEQLLAVAQIKPVANQVEFNPYLQQPEATAFNRHNGLLIESYSPLTSLVSKPGGPVDAVVDELAAQYGKSPAEVLLRWNLQKGNVIVTTSSKPERLREFLTTSEWRLTDAEVAQIDAAGQKLHFRKFWAKHFGESEE